MFQISNPKPSQTRIDLEEPDGAPIASYQFAPSLPKPCFSPLYTSAGRQITAFQPDDHLWHRGLWFTIKFINKTNFWEEHPPFGVQKTLEQPKVELSAATTAKISHKLRWTSEATGDVFDESRVITFKLLANGTRQIDWQTSLLPLQDLLLDRTPYTTWGGYGGLAFRAPVDVQNSGYLLPGGQTAATIIGQPHPWISWRAELPGEPAGKVSLAIINHPTNLRSPQPWYGKSGAKYDFMNAAFLFHESLSAPRGHRLDFRYRVLYRDGWFDAAEVSKLTDQFISEA